MILVTHCSVDAPPGHEWLAAFYTEKAGKPGERLGIYFAARTQKEVVARAERWLFAEQAKEAAKASQREKAASVHKIKKAADQ